MSIGALEHWVGAFGMCKGLLLDAKFAPPALEPIKIMGELHGRRRETGELLDKAFIERHLHYFFGRICSLDLSFGGEPRGKLGRPVDYP
jgi:hypothetical protein